ncbi:MAG: hypothetical protein CMM94_07370 [Rickettsiales bacterium]|nr:hypothetical protein [Rickettsiales bacterium]
MTQTSQVTVEQFLTNHPLNQNKRGPDMPAEYGHEEMAIYFTTRASLKSMVESAGTIELAVRMLQLMVRNAATSIYAGQLDTHTIAMADATFDFAEIYARKLPQHLRDELAFIEPFRA